MNKQELQNEINKTKEHLANMEKMLEECEYRKWIPDEGELYWFVGGGNVVYGAHFRSAYLSNVQNYNSYNYFQTREQAEAESEKILIRRRLEDIARRLNKGEKIDWNITTQYKYCLIYDNDYQHINQDYNINVIRQGTVYCLDGTFRNVAIKEIGEERLKKYLKGE